MAQTHLADQKLPRRLDEESASERIQIVATERWAKSVDEWRRKQPDIPNRSEAIRRLVDQALGKKNTDSKG